MEMTRIWLIWIKERVYNTQVKLVKKSKSLLNHPLLKSRSPNLHKLHSAQLMETGLLSTHFPWTFLTRFSQLFKGQKLSQKNQSNNPQKRRRSLRKIFWWTIFQKIYSHIPCF
jgi:hypothetical protein